MYENTKYLFRDNLKPGYKTEILECDKSTRDGTVTCYCNLL